MEEKNMKKRYKKRVNRIKSNVHLSQFEAAQEAVYDCAYVQVQPEHINGFNDYS